MKQKKKEAENNALMGRLRPVYCPLCGWKLMDAVPGTKTQTVFPRKGRYPDFHIKCGHCGAEIGITKTE